MVFLASCVVITNEALMVKVNRHPPLLGSSKP